jgi:hypothetical protein
MNLSDIVQEAARQWRREADRWRARVAADGPTSTTMLELIRPNVGAHTPPSVRRMLEPVVAASAVLALFVLGGMGIISFALFLLAGGLIYAILTKVFGLELGIELPNPNL